MNSNHLLTFEQFVILIVVGALAGWVAGLIFKRRRFGFLGNMIIGVLGSFLGRWLLALIGFGVYGHLAHFITAVFGGVTLLWLLSFLPGGRKK